jgi:putative transposase
MIAISGYTVIHHNPVKHGYASSPAAWPHSSFKQYVARGLYDPDWGTIPVDFPEMNAGE